MALHDENVVWHSHPVTVAAREQPFHGHRGVVVLWFTGLRFGKINGGRRAGRGVGISVASVLTCWMAIMCATVCAV